MINRRSYKIFNICGPVAKKTVSSSRTWRSFHLGVAAGHRLGVGTPLPASCPLVMSRARFLLPAHYINHARAANGLQQGTVPWCWNLKRALTLALLTTAVFALTTGTSLLKKWRFIWTDSLGNFLYFLTYLWGACPRTLDNKPSSFAHRYPRTWTYAQRRYKTVFRERI